MARDKSEFTNKEIAKGTLICVCFGVFIGFGMKAVDWVVPSPASEIRLMVCMAGKDTVIETCKYLEELTGDKTESGD
jgi:hypothetical protein